MPERFECAVHRGDICALCMGLASLFIVTPPMAYVAYNGLSAFVNSYPFYTHGLLGFGAVFLDGIHLGKVGAAEARHRPLLGLPIDNTGLIRTAPSK